MLLSDIKPHSAVLLLVNFFSDLNSFPLAPGFSMWRSSNSPSPSFSVCHCGKFFYPPHFQDTPRDGLKWAATGLSVFLVRMSERCLFIQTCSGCCVFPTYSRPHFLQEIRYTKFFSCTTIQTWFCRFFQCSCCISCSRSRSLHRTCNACCCRENCQCWGVGLGWWS